MEGLQPFSHSPRRVSISTRSFRYLQQQPNGTAVIQAGAVVTRQGRQGAGCAVTPESNCSTRRVAFLVLPLAPTWVHPPRPHRYSWVALSSWPP